MMNTPFSFLIALSFLLHSAFAKGQSLNEPKQTFFSENYLKEWGNEITHELRNWVGDSCRHLLVWTKADLEQHLKSTQYAGKADTLMFSASREEKSILMQSFLAMLFPKYPLTQMEWPTESMVAELLANTLNNIACVMIINKKNEPWIWDACIVFMSCPQIKEYDLGALFGEFTTGVPSTQMRNFHASNQEWHRCFMRHEAAHIRMKHTSANKKSKCQLLTWETEADCFALSDSLFALDNHPIKEEFHALRAMASLFCFRDENQNFNTAMNSHATNVFWDPSGRLERDPEKAASAFFGVHRKINQKAHLLLPEADSSLTVNWASDEFNLRKWGKKIAIDNPPLYFTALKILTEQGQFPAGSPEAVMCAEFLEACKDHIEPEYLNNPEAIRFYERCTMPPAVLKKGP